MEKIFYELKPFACIYLGVAATRTPAMDDWGVYPAVLLAALGMLFLATRIEYRFFRDKR